MQTVIVDLIKSPDIKNEVVDLEPGDEVTLHGTIKSLDGQTLVVTVDELSVPAGENTDEAKAAPLTPSEGEDDVTAPVAGMGPIDEDAAE